MTPYLYLFEPPQKWSFLPVKYKSKNTWLEHNYHGISWDSGDVPCEEYNALYSQWANGMRSLRITSTETTIFLTDIVETASSWTSRSI